mgnify:CR=1 FL=1
MCFARWQSERCGAGCVPRLADASWLAARWTQRSRAGYPASRRARCASGRATDTTAYRYATVWVVSQLARRSTAMPRPLASARWRIVLDQPSPAARLGRCVRGSCGTRPLRQNYITPHCSQCPPVSRKLLLCPRTASRPSGLRSRRYAKLPTLVRACQPSALPSRFASYVQSPVALLVCWRSGLYQALRASFSLAASPCILYVPLPTLVACLLRSIALRGLPVRPPRGLPQNRALHQLRTHLTLGASEFPAGMSIGVTAEAQC